VWNAESLRSPTSHTSTFANKMKKIISLILLIPGILFASIESSNPTPEELVKVLDYEAWKLELDSLENLEFKVEYYRYNEFKGSVSGSAFKDDIEKKKEVYIVIYRDGRVSIKYFSDNLIGGAGSQFENHYGSVSQGLKKIELPKELEIGEKYPILKSESEGATVYFTIQRHQ